MAGSAGLPATFQIMDMYPASSGNSQSSKESDSKSNSETENESESSLLPKSMFGGDCKVGDVYKVKVIAIHGDELEVEPAGEEKSDKNESSEDEDMMNPVDKMMG